jgi:hypothetical protein
MQIGTKGIEHMLVSMMLKNKTFKNTFSSLFTWESIKQNFNLEMSKRQLFKLTLSLDELDFLML